MYCISEQQIDFILNDIRRRGVEMEDLQYNLLDHVCCMVEQNLKEGEDFEAFYRRTIPKFFKRELWEIEEETITLLTFKHYYAMKKTMIISGGLSVAFLVAGSFFKIMHWPGAGMMLVLGIGLISLLFLPLMLALRVREANTTRDKIVNVIGTMVGMLLCFSTLFKIMHWPYSSILWISTSALSIFVLIPVYFFTGIRKPETKVNTIVTTIILIGATGLLFSLTSIRKSKLLVYQETKAYYQSEQLLKKMENKMSKQAKGPLAERILKTCSGIKELILMAETGERVLPPDFEQKGMTIYESSLGDEGPAFQNGGEGLQMLGELVNAIRQYNGSVKDPNDQIPLDYPFFETTADKIGGYTNLAALDNLTQIQLFLQVAESKSVASK